MTNTPNWALKKIHWPSASASLPGADSSALPNLISSKPGSDEREVQITHQSSWFQHRWMKPPSWSNARLEIRRSKSVGTAQSTAQWRFWNGISNATAGIEREPPSQWVSQLSRKWQNRLRTRQSKDIKASSCRAQLFSAQLFSHRTWFHKLFARVFLSTLRRLLSDSPLFLTRFDSTENSQEPNYKMSKSCCGPRKPFCPTNEQICPRPWALEDDEANSGHKESAQSQCEDSVATTPSTIVCSSHCLLFSCDSRVVSRFDLILFGRRNLFASMALRQCTDRLRLCGMTSSSMLRSHRLGTFLTATRIWIEWLIWVASCLFLPNF